MLGRIAAFEMRYQIRSPLFIFCFALFFLITFFSVASDRVQIGAAGNVHVNSPYAILETLGTMSVFALFVVTAFIANVVIRDQETGFAPILYATRLRKPAYLVGRFLGAICVALLLLAAVPLAMAVGAAMPWLDPVKVGPLVITHYLFALFLVGLPVLLAVGAGLFALATATRSMMWCYVGLIAFLVAYLITATTLRDPAYDHLTALLDPFGIGAFELTSKYWTAAERNTLLPPLTGVLLENRLLWLSVGAVFFIVAYSVFRFEARGVGVQKAQARGAEPGAPPPALVRKVQAPAGGGWTAFSTLMRFEMRQVFMSPAFAVLLLIGVLNSVGGLLGTLSDTYTEYLPVTRTVIGVLQGGFTIFPLVIAVYYAGELVWRERERRIHEIIDACPAPAWTILLPKVLAVSLVLCATILVGALTGMALQLLNGYFKLEPLHYLLWFVVPETIYACQMAVLGVCVQTLVPNKYIGWGVMLIYIVLSATLSNFGFEHGLYHYGYSPGVPLSDFSGMDRFFIARAWYELYWSAFAVILVAVSLLLLRRGNEARLAPRIRLAALQLRGGALAVIATAGVVFLGSGGYIYYNTVILNDYANRTDVAQERFAADYEKALLPFEKLPQPKITAVKLAVQLYPQKVRADTTGSYVIENRTGSPITDLHVRWSPQLELRSIDVGPATPVKDYGRFHYRIFRLATPLAPGEERTVRFQTRLEERGFPNRNPLHRIVSNGTFLNNAEIEPGIGMTRDLLLTDRNKRRRQGLPEDLRPPKLEDKAATALSVFHDDWVSAEISVTTDADQTPLAPGYTVSDVVKDGRRTVVTRTEAPINHFFSIQSARYAIARDVWTGKDGRKVDLAVYYHPDHPYNVARILTAMKASLDVFSERFSPYQFRQARILEFPAYERFAQSFANTIPFSEGIGFIQKYDEKTADSSVDLVTFVTAHELGHQWWGHQVVSADKQGATMLIESFAQYSAMLVMEKMYGHDQVRKFLKTNLDDYLRNRGTDAVEELPLERVENQAYIHYRKGAVVMYWLKESLGEEVVDRAMRRLIATYAFKPAPYPSTTDFIGFLKEEAGPGHDLLIDDLFARITLYEMSAHDATAHKRPDGRYDVRFTVQGRKLYADGLGNQHDVALDEPFDVGAFTVEPGKHGYRNDSVLAIQRVPVKSGSQVITLVVGKLPAVVGIDPFNEHIDRTPDDNLTPVTLQ